MSIAKRYVWFVPFFFVGAAVADTTASVLEFGLDDTLFVGDSESGAIHAYDLPGDSRARKADVAYNLLDLDGLFVDALDAEPGTVIYNDLAVHPVTTTYPLSCSSQVSQQVSSPPPCAACPIRSTSRPRPPASRCTTPRTRRTKPAHPSGR